MDGVGGGSATESVDETTNGIQRVGSFRFLYEGERWEWSDEVAVLHGYSPGEVTPTTALMAEHKHPDDRAHFEAMVAEMLTNHAPFSSRHRIIDTRGRIHPVTVIAHTIYDADGRAIGTEGFYVDLSGSVDESVKERVDAEVLNFRTSRASIEQAKGMLMLVYGVTEDRAIDVLKWRSQQENVKVREIADTIISQALAGIEIPEITRRRFDNIVLTSSTPTEPVSSE